MSGRHFRIGVLGLSALFASTFLAWQSRDWSLNEAVEPGVELYGIRNLEVEKLRRFPPDLAGQEPFHFVAATGDRLPFYLDRRSLPQPRQIFLYADPFVGGEGMVVVPPSDPVPLAVGGPREQALLELVRTSKDTPDFLRGLTVKETIDRWLLDREGKPYTEVSEVFESKQHRQDSIEDAWKPYRRAVMSGYRLIRVAQQIERVFDDVVHRIDCFHDPYMVGGPPPRFVWTSTAFFSDRYMFDFRVDVTMSPASDEIDGTVTNIIGEAVLIVSEIMSGHGTRVVGVPGSSTPLLTLAEWESVLEANGDFSVIGIELQLEQPVHSFDVYRGQFASPIYVNLHDQDRHSAKTKPAE